MGHERSHSRTGDQLDYVRPVPSRVWGLRCPEPTPERDSWPLRPESVNPESGHGILKVAGPPLRTDKAALFPDRVPEIFADRHGRVESRMHPYPIWESVGPCNTCNGKACNENACKYQGGDPTQVAK